MEFNTQNLFTFKKFSLSHQQSTLKIGTDAVLLAAWTKISTCAKVILDVGCGCGVISFILAQDSTAKVLGIDIDEKSIIEAQFNISINNFSNEIIFVKTSFQDYTLNSNKKFDLIVSNPPYFYNSLKPLSENNLKAKHADLSLPISELLKCSKHLLLPYGSLNLILPADNDEPFTNQCSNLDFFCAKKLYVKANIDSKPIRILYQLVLFPCICNVESISIETDKRHQYSNEYINLVKDFYLNL